MPKRYIEDDAAHLPPGMRRVGYDAETERYTFRRGDDLWLGEPGSFYGGQLKWAGRAADASPVNHSEGGERDNDGDGEDIADSMNWEPAPPYSAEGNPEYSRITAPPQLSPSTSRPQDDGGEWGVPVHAISDTNAKPPDRGSRSAGLKRRASRFKDAATSTVGAIGVTRRLTRKKQDSRLAQQEESLVDPKTPEKKV